MKKYFINYEGMNHDDTRAISAIGQIPAGSYRIATAYSHERTTIDTLYMNGYWPITKRAAERLERRDA